MLVRNHAQVTDSGGLLNWERGGEYVSIADIILFLKMNYLYLVAFVASGLIGSILYITTSDPVYTARTQILIEPNIPQFIQEQTTEVRLSLDTSQVETQLAVLRSEKIAMMVIDELDLTGNADFMEPAVSPAARLSNMTAMVARVFGFGGSPATSSLDGSERNATGGLSPGAATEPLMFERDRRAVGVFSRALNVNRLGVSYAIDIYFDARDPELAASIANATASAFVHEQLETRAAAASEGLQWLETRIEEVRAQMNTATRVAQEFRAKHDYRIKTPGELGNDGRAGPAGPTLEELELTAETYRKMYESLLAAFTRSVNQQPYLIADARVITAATPPLAPSHPRKTLILAFGLMAGLMAGVGLALSRHLLDRTIRTPRQVREELGMECIGELPVVRFQRGGFGRFDEVARHPQSTFSASLRSAKAAIAVADTVQPIRMIGITSATPGDGKSTVASNLAALYTRSGMRTLLIDADIYHSTLTKALADSGTGTESQERGKSEIQCISFAGQTLDLMPNSSPTVRELLSPKGVRGTLKGLERYEIIVIDLPPYTSNVSGAALGPLLDGVVVVAEWGKTPVDLLAKLSQTLQATKTSVIGAILTKVRCPSSSRYRRRALQSPR